VNGHHAAWRIADAQSWLVHSNTVGKAGNASYIIAKRTYHNGMTISLSGNAIGHVVGQFGHILVQNTAIGKCVHDITIHIIQADDKRIERLIVIGKYAAAKQVSILYLDDLVHFTWRSEGDGASGVEGRVERTCGIQLHGGTMQHTIFRTSYQ